MMNKISHWLKAAVGKLKVLSVCVAISVCLGLAFLSSRFREGATEFFWYYYVQVIGYDQMVLDAVKRRSDAADSEVAQAISLPDLQAVEQLRLLLQRHSQADPPSEDDGEWVFRIRALRALAKYETAVQAHAIPELVDLLKREIGSTSQEVRNMLLSLGCDAMPASSDLVALVQVADAYRVGLAIPILAGLSAGCKDQFLHDEEVTRAILSRVRDPDDNTSLPSAMLSMLWVFDKEGKISGETLEEMLVDPNASAALKESVQSLKVQMGLNNRTY